MNNLLFLCLIFFIIVRAVGLAVALDFFYDTRDDKFILFIIGWSVWIIASILAFYINIEEESSLTELLTVLNTVAATTGVIFYAWALFKYFKFIKVPRKFFEIFLVITIGMTFLLYFLINLVASMIFIIILLNFTLLMVFIVTLLKKKEFKESMGNTIKWHYATVFVFLFYFPISIVSFIAGYGYGAHNVNDPIIIMLNYVPTIGATVLLIITNIHLEYTTSESQKSDLKEKYSHNLGNIMQAIIFASDLTEMNHDQKKDIKANLNLIKEKTKEASKLIKQIREL